MKNLSKILLLLLFVLSILSQTALANGDTDNIKPSGTLRFGVPTERAPFVYYDESGNLTGVDVELMKEIASRMGKKLETVEMSAANLVQSLTAGQVDVIGGALSKTKSKEIGIDFSSVYYIADGVYISKGIYAQPIEGNPFAYAKIGVMNGSGFDEWIKNELYDKDLVDKKNIFTYDRIDDAMKALDGRRIDIVLIDSALFDSLYETSGNYDIYQYSAAKDSYAFGTEKESELTKEISKYLSDMFADGTAQRIADKFLVRESETNLSTLQWKTNKSKPAATAADENIVLIDDDTIPTLDVDPLEIPAANEAPVQANCYNDMVFLGDLTAPDGLSIDGGETFVKSWRVMNTGTCTWTQKYKFSTVYGVPMGVINYYLPKSVAPGEIVDITFELTAPDFPGWYTGTWQMFSPEGIIFGHPVWTEIYVPTANPEVVAQRSYYEEDDGYFFMSTSNFS
ncbi:MAG: transporter substrate-binding domain-containing protein [Anaerolineaceae bacterium]|nr:transporter substrate-binding domain-containing protein [Anaerolineaceae bacterium]